MADFYGVMEIIVMAVEAVGVIVVVVGALLAMGRYLLGLQGVPGRSYRVCRQDLGRAILLGLEFLIAADIIRTVVVASTLENVLVLGLIILIRTFLSMTLQLELEGRWPWQRADDSSSPLHETSGAGR